MHVAGANGPDEQFIAFAPEREHDEHTPPFVRPAYGAKAPLAFEWAASGRMAIGRVKRLSITEVESPCFSHLARLPLSQSKPLACTVMVAEKIGN